MENTRETLIHLMAETHKVSEDLAGYWVDQMTDAEVKQELFIRRKQ